jgi:hypothetical protein
MERIPVFLSIAFVLVTLLTLLLFQLAANRSRTVLTALLVWLVAQGIIAMTGFYTEMQTVPPRFLLLIGPPLLAIVLLFLSPRGKRFLDRLDTGRLTLLHSVRAGVELVLYGLFLYGTVPVGMTFAGGNYDIFAGVTSIFVFAFGYRQRVLGRTVLLFWNLLCLGLLVYIVRTGVLSAPTPFQRLAFDQPNVALFRFPFIWLPCCIVPLVLLAHLATIRQLLLRK